VTVSEVWLSTHFTLDELECRTAPRMPAEILRNLMRLASQLDIIRESVSRPVFVTSGWRDEVHNRRVGGASKSQHLEGLAADIWTEGLSGRQLRAVAVRLIAERRLADGGLGTYSDRPAILHYDLGPPRRWGPE